jgi:hypothetical protein
MHDHTASTQRRFMAMPVPFAIHLPRPISELAISNQVKMVLQWLPFLQTAGIEAIMASPTIPGRPGLDLSTRTSFLSCEPLSLALEPQSLLSTVKTLHASNLAARVVTRHTRQWSLALELHSLSKVDMLHTKATLLELVKVGKTSKLELPLGRCCRHQSQ